MNPLPGNKHRKRVAAQALFDHLVQDCELTNRELEVDQITLSGATGKEMGEKLFICEKSVKFHLSNIHKKMKVVNRASLMKYCYSYMMDRM